MSAELPEGASAGLHRVARWISRWPLRLPFRVKVRGRERIPTSGPVVLVANHSSLLDGPLLLGMVPRPMVFLIKQEMFSGALGWFLTRIGQIGVRRGEPDRTPLLTAVRVLKGGGVVGVFPEGTRGSGEIDNAQHGAAWLARASGAQILPVACRGTRRPEGSGRRLLPRIDVLFGEPISPAGGKGRAGLVAATETVRNELVALIAELDRQVADRTTDDVRGKRA
ncbi:1-acyl-sn-glycerol-3-phosphate acyltransferase [Saccharopolyspora karakumensis]|uniref:1-acyl-sn-glycerol-3-phosphate acyltransferase n=1 Tax=Saccharopolyspora karakumensis TaxID=2530386 RepID=A0A4R5B7G9_9PSEU|nr:lysophospholipid acyltransferase family protein [Saccharopolyspora karakumensis]TDD81871.1 1-acyl-sn-glycerol-3-phosphate acyltransferase [Saccharopolyspora karakumensis]